MTEEFTNKDDAIKIKKLLGLNGDESDRSGYYNVTDVLIALMHFCDNNKNEFNWNFDSHLISAREGYEQNKRDEKKWLKNYSGNAYLVSGKLWIALQTI